MSVFFPRFNEFSPLFRFAEELDRATRFPGGGTGHSNTRSFAPRFDVKETKEAYELHGELPGVEQSDVNIEWTDENALVVSGHTEKVYESGNELHAEDAKDVSNRKKSSVEEDGEGAAATGKAVTRTTNNNDVAKADEHRPRYWVTERSYGSFSRTFNFPANVDHDNVKASMKNGILEIVVQKARVKEPRKIQIQ